MDTAMTSKSLDTDRPIAHTDDADDDKWVVELWYKDFDHHQAMLDILRRQTLRKVELKHRAIDKSYALVATQQIAANEPFALDAGVLREEASFSEHFDDPRAIAHLVGFTIDNHLLRDIGYEGPHLVVESSTQDNATMYVSIDGSTGAGLASYSWVGLCSFASDVMWRLQPKGPASANAGGFCVYDMKTKRPHVVLYALKHIRVPNAPVPLFALVLDVVVLISTSLVCRGARPSRWTSGLGDGRSFTRSSGARRWSHACIFFGVR